MAAVVKVGGILISLFFFLLSYVAFVAAFSGTYWMQDGGTHWGLWKVCAGDLCSATVGSGLLTVAFIGSQCLMCVALILGAVSLGSYLWWLSTQRSFPCVLAWSLHLSSGFCMGMGLLCWGNESVRYYGVNVLAWSYWLAMGSCIIAIINGGVTACMTGCGAALEEESRRVHVYSATAAAQGQGVLYKYGPQHNVSDQEYSDITSSELSLQQGQRPPPAGFNLPPPKTKHRY